MTTTFTLDDLHKPIDAATKKLRLENLRRVAEAVPEHRLHMNTWCDTTAPCGTAYCLGGWAAIDPWHRENTPIAHVFSVVPSEERPGDPFVYDSYAADTTRGLMALYGLEYSDADNLFALNGGGIGEHDVTKAEVLARIDCALRGTPVAPYDALSDEDDDAEDDDDDDIEIDDEDDEFIDDDFDEDEDEDGDDDLDD